MPPIKDGRAGRKDRKMNFPSGGLGALQPQASGGRQRALLAESALTHCPGARPCRAELSQQKHRLRDPRHLSAFEPSAPTHPRLPALARAPRLASSASPFRLRGAPERTRPTGVKGSVKISHMMRHFTKQITVISVIWGNTVSRRGLRDEDTAEPRTEKEIC